MPKKQNQIRLSDQELDVVLAGYESGLTLKELSSAFGPDRRTLANRLEARGAPRRGPRLTDQQIEEAADLYGQGWSLARLGQHFGVHSESIRYRFKRAGVQRRPCNGWSGQGEKS
jgi:lambda repressor-like predicted transcriptional regulator